MSALPSYRVIVAFDNYRVGDVIQPTGLLRESLLRIRFIEPAAPKPALIQPAPPPPRRTRHD